MIEPVSVPVFPPVRSDAAIPKPRTRELLATLDQCMREDRFRLRRAIRNAGQRGKPLDALADRIAASQRLAAWRSANRPAVTFPGELPISAHVETLGEMIRRHPVLVVRGETGSGKSTQLPKACLAAGYGIHGMIGQTQPRRIAARSVAERIAAEIGSPIGEAVGYRVRFSEQVSERNYIRVLTDGMLLNEFERDRLLERYDVLIVDEAHERSLNIDFLLGLSRRILKKRPDFRLVITSATLDSERFSSHFDDAPVVTVSGRLYPVELRYRPMTGDDNGIDALPAAIAGALDELHGEAPGDTLVFLPGEREIRDTAEWLRRRAKPGLEVLPLYARLTPAEQQRIFSPGQAIRVILATNVAETSLTVPGIRYVIDSGLARVSRYSPTRKLQRLPLEKISRAAADQRSGRCGRVASGICIRLYDEDDFDNRAEYTDPEIRRTSLADVILRMKTLGIGDIETFPFVEAPDRRQINDGLQQLVELGALDGERSLTDLGRRIASIPVDPRIARMLLAAEGAGCLDDVVVIAAALSLPDPRQSPADQLQKSRERHRALSRETSDFLVLLDIWRQFRRIQKTESKRQSFRWCGDNFLSVFRMREWGALQANIRQSLRRLGFRVGGGSDPDAIHRALLTGLLCNVALVSAPAANGDRRGGRGAKKSRGATYDGTFGKSLRIFPGSVLQGSAPRWIMCAELVETGQVYARTVAGVEAGWIEAAAGHLLQYHYSDPHWDPRQERVVARRRATLYGLTVYSGRKCDYSRINPVDCRAIFIRAALVDGALDSRLGFYNYNRALVEEIESLEHRTRRRDILVDDAEIFAFYDEVIPADINSASALRKWHRTLGEDERQALRIPRERLLLGDPGETLEQFPDRIDNNGIALPLDYLYDPSSDQDGVTARVRLPLLNQVSAPVLERLVPGLLGEKLEALTRSLPKSLRRNLVPIPDTVAAVRERVATDPRPLRVALAEAIAEVRGIDVSPADFDPSALPGFLRIGIAVVGEDERILGYGRDLEALQSEFGGRAHASFVDSGDAKIERDGITRWDFTDLPESIRVRVGEYETVAWPALVDCEDSVAIEVFDREEIARIAHRDGVRRLLWLTLPNQRRLLRQPLPDWQRISLLYAAVGDLSALQLAMLHKAQDRVFFEDEPVVRTRAAFESLVTRRASELPAMLETIARQVAATLAAHHTVRTWLGKHSGAISAETLADVREQVGWLVYDGFVDDTPARWLGELARYLEGVSVRLEQARLDPQTDLQRLARIKPWQQRFMTADYDYSEPLVAFRWMLEEFRVSVFAQGLGTSVRVSDRRLAVAWEEVEAFEAQRPFVENRL